MYGFSRMAATGSLGCFDYSPGNASSSPHIAPISAGSPSCLQSRVVPIRSLLLSDDPAQQTRIGIWAVGAASYLVYSLIQALEVSLGLMDLRESNLLIAAMVGSSACFYAVYRGGWGRRIGDAPLTPAHTAARRVDRRPAAGRTHQLLRGPDRRDPGRGDRDRDRTCRPGDVPRQDRRAQPHGGGLRLRRRQGKRHEAAAGDAGRDGGRLMACGAAVHAGSCATWNRRARGSNLPP